MSFILLLVLPLLYFTAIVYIQIGSTYRIYPKHQIQSRRNRIVKGLGILFPLAWTVFMVLNDFAYPVFTVGLWLVSLFAFADDVLSINRYLQMAIHLVGLTSIFLEMKMLNMPPLQLSLAYLFGFLVLQSIQTLDGANGMVGSMAISIILSFVLMDPNSWQVSATNPFLYMIFGLLVFAYFNFRAKAVAFGGTIGRTSMGLILAFFLFQAMIDRTNFQDFSEVSKTPQLLHPQYILFFSIMMLEFFYVLYKRSSSKKDPFLVEGEQYFHVLKTKMGLPPLTISFIYAILQFGLNVLLVILN